VRCLTDLIAEYAKAVLGLAGYLLAEALRAPDRAGGRDTRAAGGEQGELAAHLDGRRDTRGGSLGCATTVIGSRSEITISATAALRDLARDRSSPRKESVPVVGVLPLRITLAPLRRWTSCVTPAAVRTRRRLSAPRQMPSSLADFKPCETDTATYLDSSQRPAPAGGTFLHKIDRLIDCGAMGGGRRRR
jgi:hypothetical protein